MKTTNQITRKGNLNQITSTSKGTVIKTTSFNKRFMNWLLVGEIMEENQKLELQNKIQFWEAKGGDNLRGTFNLNHYEKVLMARENLGLPEIFINPFTL